MTLIECPECGKMISDKAEFCVGCGYPLQKKVLSNDIVQNAKIYFEVGACSKKKLIELLEFEGYSRAEAIFAASNCSADWKEQAIRAVKEYLNIQPFSYQEMLEQLEFDGYTHEEAQYAVDKIYR